MQLLFENFFYKVLIPQQKKLYGIYTPSISYVILNLINICYMFNNNSTIGIFKLVFGKMEENFNEYFDDLYVTILL